MVLTPRAVDTVDIPVLAAGGIGDGRGLVAAMALGAQGVVMGTRFMATKECPIHENLKRRMMEAKETDTMIIDRAIRSARRVLRNATAERVLGMQQLDSELEEQLTFMGGEVSRKLWEEGQLDVGVISSGQCVGLIYSVPTVDELVRGIISQVEDVLDRMSLALIKK